MILSEWWESVLARNCNLIPVLTPHLLGSVNPIYVINGEMGLSKPNMHGEAENVMKGLKDSGEAIGTCGDCGKLENPRLSKEGRPTAQPVVAIITTAPLLLDVQMFSEARELDFGVNSYF